MKKYTLAFLFDYSLESVALIRKQRPAWQRGKSNGIGGHIKPGETPNEACAREFAEETGVHLAPEHWFEFAEMTGPDFVVHCFTAGCAPRLARVASMTDEKVSVVDVADIGNHNIIPNLFWLIPMARDFLQCGLKMASIKIE